MFSSGKMVTGRDRDSSKAKLAGKGGEDVLLKMCLFMVWKCSALTTWPPNFGAHQIPFEFLPNLCCGHICKVVIENTILGLKIAFMGWHDMCTKNLIAQHSLNALNPEHCETSSGCY